MNTPSIRPQITSRRRERRVYMRCPVVVTAGGRMTHTSTIDVSCGGACIAYDLGDAPLPKGPMRLLLGAQGQAPLDLLGLAIWQGPGAYGVRFLLMTDIDRLGVTELFDHLRTPEDARSRAH